MLFFTDSELKSGHPFHSDRGFHKLLYLNEINQNSEVAAMLHSVWIFKNTLDMSFQFVFFFIAWEAAKRL